MIEEDVYLEVNPKIGSSSLASCTDQKQIYIKMRQMTLSKVCFSRGLTLGLVVGFLRVLHLREYQDRKKRIRGRF